MPIFDYKCKECGAKFELLVSSSTAQVECGECKSDNVERKVSAFSVGRIANGCAVQKECPSGHKCGGGCAH